MLRSDYQSKLLRIPNKNEYEQEWLELLHVCAVPGRKDAPAD